MSAVELSIQLQIQDIAAVQEAYSASVAGRDPQTLWWLVDSASNIVYENRVKGSTISAIDDSVTNVKIGSSIFGDWFNLQNAYFSQDKPLVGVSSLKQAIEAAYRWRVPQYFNDVAKTGGSAISPQYVFPHTDFDLGVFEVGGAPAFTKGVGPVDPAVAGPGILKIIPIEADTGAEITLALTVVYPDGTTGTLAAIVPAASTVDDGIAMGWTSVTAPYTGPGNGIVSVTNSANFRVGSAGKVNLVVIAEDHRGTTPFLFESEVAEVVAVGAGQLTLRQPTPPGAAAPFPNGLRNSYTTAAKVFPLFTDVNAATSSAGDTGDKVQLSFYPDWPQGFVDVSGLATGQ